MDRGYIVARADAPEVLRSRVVRPLAAFKYPRDKKHFLKHCAWPGYPNSSTQRLEARTQISPALR